MISGNRSGIVVVYHKCVLGSVLLKYYVRVFSCCRQETCCYKISVKAKLSLRRNLSSDGKVVV